MTGLLQKYPQIPLGRAKDLSNQKFGKWTPLYRTISSSKRTYWICQCDCGNIKPIDAATLSSGRSLSCGCLQAQDKVNDYIQSKIGTLVNKWQIIGKGQNPKNWLFKCTCGSEIEKEMRLDSASISKGCSECSTAKNKFVDLTGQTFGNWIVLERAPSINGHTMWRCQCQCSQKTIKEVDAYRLKNGTSLSCGCLHYSKGEDKIFSLLTKANIPFKTQKTFTSCKSNKDALLRFDFYVNDTYLIEYDGEQHFKTVDIGWNSPEKLKATQQRDEIKNQWCKENNIPLIRIPYTHLKDLCIEDLQLETTKFRKV